MELSNWWQVIVSIIFPQRCLECQEEIEVGHLFCPSCHRALTYRRYLHPRSYESYYLQGICLLFRYEGGMKVALHSLKYHRRASYLQYLAEELLDECYYQELVEVWNSPSQVVVVPLPTDETRRKARGYDIPMGIFKPWCVREGMAWLEALQRVKKTQPQYGLSQQERRKNVAGCFKVAKNVKNMDILLVDDIFTSGATMEEAAKTLVKAGAHGVYALTLAGGADL